MANDGSLHEASRRLHTGVMRLLIRKGHDPNYRSPIHQDRTALAELALNASVPADTNIVLEALEILCNAGANPLMKSNGKSVLFHALDNSKNEPMVSALLQSAAARMLDSPETISETTACRYSPIMYVAKGILLGPKSEAIIQLLRTHGLGETQPPSAVRLPGVERQCQTLDRRNKLGKGECFDSMKRHAKSPQPQHARRKRPLRHDDLYEQDRVVAEREMQGIYRTPDSHEKRQTRMTTVRARRGYAIGRVDLEELRKWQQREEYLKQEQAICYPNAVNR